MNSRESRVKLKKDYLILTRYSETFRNRVKKDYNETIESIDDEVIIKTNNKDVNRVEEEMFNEKSEIGIEKYVVDENSMNLLISKNSSSEITDCESINTTDATIHYVFGKEEIENTVYIVGKHELVKDKKYEFIIWLKDVEINAKIKEVIETNAKIKEALETKELETKRLKEELTNKGFDIESFKLLPLKLDKTIDAALPEELEKYLKRGKNISISNEVQQIKYLIKCIYDSKVPKQLEIAKGNIDLKIYMDPDDFKKRQFLFICASSGTGKTQLAFSLNIPLIYFNFNSKVFNADNSDKISNIQTIYRSYIPISKLLMMCVSRDIGILESMTKERIAEWDLFIDVYQSLYLPGLICLLIEEILKRQDNNKEEPWIVSELRVSNIEIGL